MIERFSNRIADLCVKCLPEQKDKRDIIQYGTESITATLVNWILVLVFGLLLCVLI